MHVLRSEVGLGEVFKGVVEEISPWTRGIRIGVDVSNHESEKACEKLYSCLRIVFKLGGGIDCVLQFLGIDEALSKDLG